MAQPWIEELAQDIKQKNHGAAEDYGRSQHYAGIVATQGKEFFVATTLCLQENVDALRSQLQGDLTASDTRMETTRVDEIKIVRSRFPWVDARLTHQDASILLDYAKGTGIEGDPKLDRKTIAFVFRVGPGDELFVEDAFPSPDTAHPSRYAKPDDLAHHLTKILFTP
jgi:hypothetical protein